VHLISQLTVRFRFFSRPLRLQRLEKSSYY
jgi:hypothetical protein